MIISDPKDELERLVAARQKTIEELDKIYRKLLQQMGKEEASIFQIHAMMLEDDDFFEAIQEKILGEKVNAEYAVQSVGRQFSEQFAQMDDEYMRGRAADVLDIASRLIRSMEKKGERGSGVPQAPSIVGAVELMPSETIT